MATSVRSKFRLTHEQFDRLLAACRPVPYMVFGGMAPPSPQENANAAWCALGRELGFDGMSVEPADDADGRGFYANVADSVATS